MKEPHRIDGARKRGMKAIQAMGGDQPPNVTCSDMTAYRCVAEESNLAVNRKCYLARISNNRCQNPSGFVASMNVKV